VAGRDILIWGEGGAGDEILFCRFASYLAERGAKVTWASRNGLEELLTEVEGISRALPLISCVGLNFDRVIPSMDLPRLLRVGRSEVERSAPYIRPSRETPPFGANGRAFRIGLRWQGNENYATDALRRVRLSELASLLEVDDSEFYSLQRDAGQEQLKDYSAIRRVDDELTTWERTARLVSNLDLVITSCTAIAHLAAAMGKPAWVLRPLMHYFVWAEPGPRSPWYPSVRLFDQIRFGSWKEPVQEMKDALRGMIASR
jgi:hypothetical protein